MSETRKQLEEWLGTLQISGNVLDVGGSQNPIDARVQEWEVDDYKILDLQQPHETKRMQDIVVDIQEFIDWGQKFWFEYLNEFDVAFCIEVSEYWWHPVRAIENIRKFLKRDGVLYISFHFVYPVHNPVDQDYLRYTPRGAEKLLQEAGFEIVQHVSRVGSYQVSGGVRPAKNYDHSMVGSLIKAQKK